MSPVCSVTYVPGLYRIEYMAGGTGFHLMIGTRALVGRRKKQNLSGEEGKENLSRRRGVLDNADLVIHG